MKAIWLRRLGFKAALALFAALFVAWLLVSCINYKSVSFILNLDTSNLYSGTLNIEFEHIHSTKSDLAEQEKEMAEFLLDYRKDAANFLEYMPLLESKVELTKTTKTSTNGYISGSFKNVFTVLGALFHEEEFSFSGNKRKLAVSWKNPLKENDEMFLVIRYGGKIISHNSKSFDAATGTMKWDMSRHGDAEIRFELQSE